jgi:hypothetical protein
MLLNEITVSSEFCWFATVPRRNVVLELLIMEYHHQAPCLLPHHVEACHILV